VAVTAEGCLKKQVAPAPLSSWPRPYFQPTSAKALVWYQIYGHFSDTIEISRSTYRCAGVPGGIEITNHPRPSADEVGTGFLTRPFFVAALKRELPQLASTVQSAPECTIIRGELADSANLDYLRDVVGLVTWFFDNGAVAVLDPQTAVWYDRPKWRDRIFDPNAAVPTQHVVVFCSEETGVNTNLFWYHTRGMRKFARPDISIRNVPAQNREGAINLLNRMIEAQALGQVIPEGQPVQMKSLPPGLICHHAGNVADPDFNNAHVEIRWPK